jgi:hypothetical protein
MMKAVVTHKHSPKTLSPLSPAKSQEAGVSEPYRPDLQCTPQDEMGKNLIGAKLNNQEKGGGGAGGGEPRMYQASSHMLIQELEQSSVIRRFKFFRTSNAGLNFCPTIVLHEWATEPKEFHELRNRINGLAD